MGLLPRPGTTHTAEHARQRGLQWLTYPVPPVPLREGGGGREGGGEGEREGGKEGEREGGRETETHRKREKKADKFVGITHTTTQRYL